MTLQNFKRLASGLKVDGLLRSLGSNPEAWDEITERQTTPGSAHTDTKTIFLRWCESKTLPAVFAEIPAIDYPAYEKFPEARNIIAFVRSQLASKDLGRVLIVALQPGGYITPHVDEGDYADHYERFHVCLKSKACAFSAGDPEKEFETVLMEEGELWWFNHKVPHWVFNQGQEERIHLIIDCVAPQFRRERSH